MSGMGRMRIYGAGLFIAGGFGLAAFEAQAVRSDNIEVKVTSSTESLSYGKPGTYTFYVANFTNGNINNIRFRATLSAGEFAENNPINAGAPAVCTRVNLQAIDCSITGGIESFGFSTFDFAFTAPASGPTEEVSLSWNVRFGQGSATNFIVSTPGTNPADVALITTSTTHAKAYIPPSGDNLFTGTNIPSVGDPFTVGIVVNPAANRVVTAAITESACSQPTHKCAQLNVFRKETQPNGELAFFLAQYTGDPVTTDLDQRLVFVFRLAASEVAGKNIRHASVSYGPDINNLHQVLECPKGQPNYVPPVGQPPCLARKVEYTKRTAPSADLIGAWELELWGSRNGFIDIAF